MAKTEEIQEKVRALIDEEPSLTDPSQIVTKVVRTGSLFAKKRTWVHLEGTVPSQKEKMKAEAVVDGYFRDQVAVKNLLEVAP